MDGKLYKKLDQLGVVKHGHHPASGGRHLAEVFHFNVLLQEEHDEFVRDLVYDAIKNAWRLKSTVYANAIFVGPMSFGRDMARMASEELLKRQRVYIPHVWLKPLGKGTNKTFEWGEERFAKQIPGTTVIWTDDLFHECSTLRRTLPLLKGAKEIIATAILDRGDNTAEEQGIDGLVSLEKVNVPSYAPGPQTCPLCKDGIPLKNVKKER